MVGQNASDEPLVTGALLLFADDAQGRRTRLESVSGSVDDAIVCFLTTGLHSIAIGDYIVERAVAPPCPLDDLVLAPCDHVEIAPGPSRLTTSR